MTDFTPSIAPISVLAFLGTGFVLVIGALIALYAALRRSKILLAIAGTGGIVVAALYLGILLGFSLFSREVDLPIGAKKYFCEIDCHISYSVLRVWMPKSVGGETEQVTSKGQFVVVELRTWFDPSTISPRRGDGPLTPNDRVAVLRDAQGRVFELSPRANKVIAAQELHSTPFATALRPGESYISYLVFEVPSDTREPKLWVRSSGEVDALLWGDERSPMHQKVLFLLSPAADAARYSL
jgi:hypothetical protein